MLCRTSYQTKLVEVVKAVAAPPSPCIYFFGSNAKVRKEEATSFFHSLFVLAGKGTGDWGWRDLNFPIKLPGDYPAMDQAITRLRSTLLGSYVEARVFYFLRKCSRNS